MTGESKNERILLWWDALFVFNAKKPSQLK
jgi:hypothetical protein